MCRPSSAPAAAVLSRLRVSDFWSPRRRTESASATAAALGGSPFHNRYHVDMALASPMHLPKEDPLPSRLRRVGGGGDFGARREVLFPYATPSVPQEEPEQNQQQQQGEGSLIRPPAELLGRSPSSASSPTSTTSASRGSAGRLVSNGSPTAASVFTNDLFESPVKVMAIASKPGPLQQEQLSALTASSEMSTAAQSPEEGVAFAGLLDAVGVAPTTCRRTRARTLSLDDDDIAEAARKLGGLLKVRRGHVLVMPP